MPETRQFHRPVTGSEKIQNACDRDRRAFRFVGGSKTSSNRRCDQLLLKLGAAQTEAGRAKSLVSVKLPKAGQPVTPETFAFMLNRERIRACRRHEGRYLLRSNLTGQTPAELWAFYIQLTEVEQAFK